MNKVDNKNGTKKQNNKSIIYVPVNEIPSKNDVVPEKVKINGKNNNQNKKGNKNPNLLKQTDNNNNKNNNINNEKQNPNRNRRRKFNNKKNNDGQTKDNGNINIKPVNTKNQLNQQFIKKRQNNKAHQTFAPVDAKKKDVNLKKEDIKKKETRRNKQPQVNNNAKKRKNRANRNRTQIFEPHLNDITKILEKVASGEFKFGTIQYLAYLKVIANVKNMDKPVYLLDRDFNRALDGDKVVIQIHDPSKWMTRSQINEFIRNKKMERRNRQKNKDKNNQEKKDEESSASKDAVVNEIEIVPVESDDTTNGDDQLDGNEQSDENELPNVSFTDESNAVEAKETLNDDDDSVHVNDIDNESESDVNNGENDGEDVENIVIDEIPEIVVNDEDDDDDENIIDDDDDDNELYPTGKVVYICPRPSNQSFIYSGRLSDKGYFVPFNDKIPIFFVSNRRNYESKDIERHVFTVEYERWDECFVAPFGRIISCIEKKDDIDTQLEILLSEIKIDQSEYPESIVKHFPKEVSITEEDLKERVDLRNTLVVSIDPPTARDLDDAVSIEKLENGHFKVGVHIADVTHYVKPNDPIDQIARNRCITFYFIHKVIPMLPEILSSHLCSLLGGKDRLSFSVIWEMDSEGNIYDTWIGKTIIHSSAKLSYDDATMIIDSSDNFDKCREILKDKIEKTDNDDLLVTRIIDALVSVNKIAENLRTKRFSKGVLNVRSFRLQFEFENEDYHNIKSFMLYQQTKSSYLIEELMIQANISVATKIKEVFPDASLLRYHPPPKDTELMKLEKFFTKRGQSFDGTSVEALLKTIQSYNETERMAFDVLFLDALHPSLYYCSNSKRNELETRHYGLNIELYTHFTSPIRRYADIIVHRILDHILKLEKDNSLEKKEIIGKDEIESVCELINKQARVSRTSALKCEDIFLYRWMLDQKEKVVDDKCIVLKMRGKSKELVAFSTLLMRKVYVPLPEKYYKVDEKKYEITGKNGKESIFLKYLSQIKVELGVENKGNRKKFIGKLCDDNGELKVVEKKESIEVN